MVPVGEFAVPVRIVGVVVHERARVVVGRKLPLGKIESVRVARCRDGRVAVMSRVRRNQTFSQCPREESNLRHQV